MDTITEISMKQLILGQPVYELGNMLPERLLELNSVFFDEHGFVKTLPAEIYCTTCTHDELRVWCFLNSIYQIPTTELIEFIANHIEGKAIEIGSGNGSVGRALKIPITDSKVQESGEVKQIYDLYKQPTINYPVDVMHMNATRAVNKLKPDTVVGCWVTEWSKYPSKWTSYWGVDEENILYKKKYIFVGNLNTHENKKILKYEHQTYQFPWIVSRANKQEDNMIWIWDKTIH